MKSLYDIWNELPLKSDKGDAHTYLSLYEEIFEPYRTTAKNILEIGLFNGASLLMWEQYFSGKVYGIDCSKQPHGGMADLRTLIAEGTHTIFIGDATSESDVEGFFKDIKFDVLIDDGNHLVESQLRTVELFKDKMSSGGLMVIEDIQSIDQTREVFENVNAGKEILIIDRRHINGRYDDVVVLIFF